MGNLLLKEEIIHREKVRQLSHSKEERPNNSKWNYLWIALEKEVATLSSILAWVVPWTEELGRVYEVTKMCPWGHIRIGHELPTGQQQQQQ